MREKLAVVLMGVTGCGKTTIGELLRKSGDDLLESKNFGVTSLNEVREKLEQMDHEFHQAMLITLEKLHDENNIDIRDIGAVASILLDTVEEVAPELFHDDEDDGDDGDDDDDSGNDGSGNALNAEKHEAEA